MQRFRSFQAWYMSFYSRDLYQDVGRNWKGIGWGYLFVLLALSWLPLLITMHVQLNQWARTDAATWLHDFPRITITNGVVTCDRPTPYVMNDEKGNPVFMIDLTGQYTTLEQSKTKALLTKDKIITKQNVGETRIYDLSHIDSFWVDRERLLGWIRAGATWFALGLFPFAVLGSFVFRAFQNLVYSGICMAFAQGIKTALQFNTAMRLAAVAVTPAIIVDTLADVVHLNFPGFWLVKFGMTMVYLYIAVQANQTTATPVIPSAPPPPMAMTP